MKLILSKILYHIGDIISLTTMKYGKGFGYSVYSRVMLWSCNLDKNGKIWKHVKSNNHKKRRVRPHNKKR
jgi:hypothetical protein